MSEEDAPPEPGMLRFNDYEIGGDVIKVLARYCRKDGTQVRAVFLVHMEVDESTDPFGIQFCIDVTANEKTAPSKKELSDMRLVLDGYVKLHVNTLYARWVANGKPPVPTVHEVCATIPIPPTEH